MSASKRKSDIAFLAVLSLLTPSVASAYLDPGSGSYILQVLLAGFVAAAFTLKVFWTRFTTFFGGLFGRRGADKSKDD